MPNVTATEAAKTVRTALKAAGIAARAVSVRTDHGSLQVEIKAEGVDFPTVERIARGQEKISRDHAGDILAGGNTYVSVLVAREVVDAAVLAIQIDADGCFRYRGRKACPLFDGDRQIGWHVDGWKGWRLESVRGAVEAIAQMPNTNT